MIYFAASLRAFRSEYLRRPDQLKMLGWLTAGNLVYNAAQYNIGKRQWRPVKFSVVIFRRRRFQIPSAENPGPLSKLIFLQPGVSCSIASRASPTARNSPFLISAFRFIFSLTLCPSPSPLPRPSKSYWNIRSEVWQKQWIRFWLVRISVMTVFLLSMTSLDRALNIKKHSISLSTCIRSTHYETRYT